MRSGLPSWHGHVRAIGLKMNWIIGSRRAWKWSSACWNAKKLKTWSWSAKTHFAQSAVLNSCLSPIPDRGLPESMNAAMRFAKEIAIDGKATAIHCRAGIGRSSLVAAAVMISGGETAEKAMRAIQEARGLPIPDTDAQRVWIMELERHQ
jgi:protein-tyrosine phosphatase